MTRSESAPLGRGGPPCPPAVLADYVDGLVEGTRGTLVQRQKDRSVWEVEEDGVVWFVKRGVTPKRQREIRREADNARTLEAMGLGPAVLAAGSYQGAQWLVTESAGPGTLAEWGVTVRPVAGALRRLHDAGLSFPDFIGEHVAVKDDGRVEIIDSARLTRHSGRPSAAHQAVDIAAFLFSTREILEGWSRAERLRFVRLVTAEERPGLRRMLARVERRVLHLADRTRWRHGHFGYGADFINELFARYADSTRADVWRLPAFTSVRVLPDRENLTLGRGPDGRPLFFVKVFPPTKKGWSPAMRELAAIDLFQRAGVLVNRVAAYAEDVDKGSMVAVKAAAGVPLDDLLRRGVSVAERRALAVQTARIWRRMRECGLRHRDAYPCHLFAAPWGNPKDTAGTVPDAGTVPRHELRLIDLTRAGRVPFPKERWFVKDAAALWHGLPRPPVTRTDAVRWLREYFRIEKLDARAKRFARRVAAKERRIAARQKRKGR